MKKYLFCVLAALCLFPSPAYAGSAVGSMGNEIQVGTSTLESPTKFVGTGTIQVNKVGTDTVEIANTTTATWGSITGDPNEQTDTLMSQAEAEGGTNTVSKMPSALRIAQAIAALPGTTTPQVNNIRLSSTNAEHTAQSYGQLYVYTTSKTPIAYGTETVLLLRMDNPGTTTFTDSSPSNHTITANGNTIGTTTAKFGSGGAAFDGSGDYLSVPDSDDFYLDGDFTIDGWLRFNNASGIEAIYSHGTGGGGVGFGIDHRQSTNEMQLVIDAGTVMVFKRPYTVTNGVYSHFALVRQGNNWYMFKDGVQCGSTLSQAHTMTNYTGNIGIGVRIDLGGDYLNGQIDELRVSKGIARWTSNFTPPTQEYGDKYNYYSATYIPPGTTTPKLIIQDAGTSTANTYMMANVNTLIVGEGTTTSATGTTTTYSGWFTGAVRATAFNVASTEKIKENIKPIKIKPEQLEAESQAKIMYIAEKKPAWFAANETFYTYAGTDSATYVDTDAMEAAYASYIETEWASDLNQPTYVENVQKEQERYFWQLFDAVQPKSWNPREKLSLTRKGFVVEEVPDEIKGDDKQTIDPMALLAYTTVVLQNLKQDTVRIMHAELMQLQALQELAATGTFTTYGIDEKVLEIQDRLSVLEITPTPIP